jgi:hypothetical protein
MITRAARILILKFRQKGLDNAGNSLFHLVYYVNLQIT